MLRLLLLLPLAAAPAAASCVTSADFDGAGVVLATASGDTEVLRRRADGVTESVLKRAGPKVVHSAWMHGIYLIEMKDIAPKDTVTATLAFEFPTALANLPMPFPEGSFSMRVLGLTETGTFDEAQAYRFGTPGVLTFGDCSYDTVQVQLSFDGGTSSDVFHYFPDFDVAYLDRSRQDGGLDTVEAYSSFEVLQ